MVSQSVFQAETQAKIVSVESPPWCPVGFRRSIIVWRLVFYAVIMVIIIAIDGILVIVGDRIGCVGQEELVVMLVMMAVHVMIGRG